MTTRKARGAGQSHFGGAPLIGPAAPLPACELCGGTPTLFLQLDSRDLPTENLGFEVGILQLFHCLHCNENWDAGTAFNKASQIRICPDDRLSPAPIALELRMPCRMISGWEAFNDYPHPQDHAPLGVDLRYDFDLRQIELVCQQYDVHFKGLSMDDVDEDDLELAEAISMAAHGDKLGGWPHWVQSRDYPSCPKCDQEMQLFFQLDSVCNLDFMFGDAGCAHITQCPVHRDEFAFAWACH